MTEDQQYDTLRRWGFSPAAVLRRGGPPAVAAMAAWLRTASEDMVNLLRVEMPTCNACAARMIPPSPGGGWVCPYCSGEIPAWVAPEAPVEEEWPG